MEAKLSISDIEYIYNLAGAKTDEELAKIINKPVALVQMQFALMDGLPVRPWEKVVVPDIPALPAASNDKPAVKSRKPSALRPLKVGKKKKKVASKKKPAGKKEKPVKVKEEKKPHSAHAQAMERQKIKQVRDRNSIYATRPLDLTGKVRVKLNSKTDVWVDPGTDIEKLKKNLKIA
jgi:hypothetical protein